MTQSTVSSVAHSPAPWHIEPAPSASSMKSIRTEAGKAVAFVNRGPSAEADERVISAAPDAVDALRLASGTLHFVLLKAPGYDWNADPLALTQLTGDLFTAIDAVIATVEGIRA